MKTHLLSIFAFSLLASLTSLTWSQELELKPRDRICLVGNALGERMQHQNYWETLLHQRFPEHELVVRNLCFPGDEPNERIRSKNFGSPDDHLTHSKANVILFFFGFNESFADEKGLSAFRQEIKDLIAHTKSQKYDGEAAPRMVFVSPIAFEKLNRPHLPDAAESNRRLELYTQALKEVTAEESVGFVDVFHATKHDFEDPDTDLTLNGAHLNSAGYKSFATTLDYMLFEPKGDFAVRTQTKFDPTIRAEIADKNFHWWHRYRAVNGFSIYGDRGEAGSDGTYRNREVMERERAILDQMAANRDRRIWALAQGKDVAPICDDSNTLPFIVPKTNVGGPDDRERKLGKLGSLDYLPAEEQLKLFKLAPGYEIQLVASEEQFPELSNPVALNFDNQGRLWVTVMPSYPHWKPQTELNDKVLIFEDHDGDGRADECKVFADGLHQPTGFEIGNGGVYVAEQPDILFLKDTDGDDKADVEIRQLIGFDSADTHHGLAAFEWGPGGNLYFQEGTFKFSQVESPYGLTRLHEAGIWRYHPKTERFGVHVSMSFSNPWGHVFDAYGQDFIADASPGYNYWAAPISGHIEYPLKHPGGSQHSRLAKETGGDPGFSFYNFFPKRIRPSAGNELVSSRHFLPEDQGDYLLANVIGERAILQHSLADDGTGFIGKEKRPLLMCDDGNFRPIDLQFAPDGSLYIVDWHNALIGHLQHNLREPNRDHSHGRIWRVVCKDRDLLESPKIAGASIAELLNLLKEPEDRTRYRVRRELAERDSDEVIAALSKWTESLKPINGDNDHEWLEALWVCQTHHHVNENLLDELLSADDHRIRAAAVRVLSFWVSDVEDPHARLAARINDEHPRVRLEAVRACSFLEGDETIELVLDVLNHPMDDYLTYTLDETMRALEQQ